MPTTQAHDGARQHPEQRLLPAATTEDTTFMRQVARRLVSSWLESIRLGQSEGRRSLEVAMSNLERLEPVGDQGESVAFEGRLHRAESPVSTGARVTVVRPGWRLVEDDGEYVVEQALVKS